MTVSTALLKQLNALFARSDIDCRLASSALRPLKVPDLKGIRCYTWDDGPARVMAQTVKFSKTPEQWSADQCPVFIFAPGCTVGFSKIVIRRPHCVCYFGAGALLRELTIRMIGQRSTLVIGRDVQTGETTFVLEENGTTIAIGDDCLFSHGIRLRTSDMHGIYDLDSGERLNPPGDIVLARRVWVGQDVHILKGVTIGQSSVIGASAMVTQSIPEHTLSVGVPAKVVRSRITWSKQIVPDASPDEE
ncbi:MAG TPA: acyltransferase [Rhizomicrobium sp.]|jgi:acetyltransferase-like isoleucine patch superfamily enzyme